MGKFKVGDKVCKASGYHYVGEVVGVYTKTTGETRYDIEFVGIGMLHIFGENGLIKLQDNTYRACTDIMSNLTNVLDMVREREGQKQKVLFDTTYSEESIIDLPEDLDSMYYSDEYKSLPESDDGHFTRGTFDVKIVWKDDV